MVIAYGRQSRRQPRMLLLEDDLLLATAMATALRGHGYLVELSGTVQKGLDALAVRAPDLLRIDVNLPDRKGWRVAEAGLFHTARLPRRRVCKSTISLRAATASRLPICAKAF